MSSGVLIAIIITVLVIVAVGAFLAHTARKHPEKAAGHAPPDQPARPLPPVGEQHYPGVDRPGGPGAEGQAVPGPGSIAPGPPPAT